MSESGTPELPAKDIAAFPASVRLKVREDGTSRFFVATTDLDLIPGSKEVPCPYDSDPLDSSSDFRNTMSADSPSYTLTGRSSFALITSFLPSLSSASLRSGSRTPTSR